MVQVGGESSGEVLILCESEHPEWQEAEDQEAAVRGRDFYQSQALGPRALSGQGSLRLGAELSPVRGVGAGTRVTDQAARETPPRGHEGQAAAVAQQLQTSPG